MSIEWCKEHSLRFDTDFVEACALCSDNPYPQPEWAVTQEYRETGLLEDLCKHVTPKL